MKDGFLGFAWGSVGAGSCGYGAYPTSEGAPGFALLELDFSGGYFDIVQ